MKKVIIDTDIGTDVDDALALVFAVKHPACQVLGVTTVHADAALRARVARKLLRILHNEDIPIACGEWIG